MSISISRHYLTINGRRVHYRRAGKGPPLLMVHQSPRSSGEYEELMQQWGAQFTCIAPDTPGFGQSEPLAKAVPDINDYADALAEFVHAVGLDRVPAYGFHSGAIILITALKRHPALFTGIAAGGYAVWTEAESKAFGENYTPPFLPLPYGEHLIWGWNRILEQSWFFPWYDARPETRLASAHDDPARVQDIMMEILAAGDSFRLGYAAVLRAPRDVPPPGSVTAPVLITAYDADPLQVHIDRLGAMPPNWSAFKVATPAEHLAESLSFLRGLESDPCAPLAQDPDQGFIHIQTDQFDGLIHWHGADSATAVTIPAPGRAAALVNGAAFDPPGHGLSDDWKGAAPTAWQPWREVFEAACIQRGFTAVHHENVAQGDPDQLFPSFAPDRFGCHLTKAWAIVRARHFFEPWYAACASNARDFDPAALAPERLALEHLALLQARTALAFAQALTKAGGESFVDP